jgi:hypothetical protein
VIALALLAGDVGGAQREPAAIWHGVTGVDREVHDHLLELGNVDLDRPEIAADIASVYDRHHYADENKRVMEATAAKIMALVEGRPGTGAKVVRLPSGAIA